MDKNKSTIKKVAYIFAFLIFLMISAALLWPLAVAVVLGNMPGEYILGAKIGLAGTVLFSPAAITAILLFLWVKKRLGSSKGFLIGYIVAVAIQFVVWVVALYISREYFQTRSILAGLLICLIHGYYFNFFDEKILNKKVNQTA